LTAPPGRGLSNVRVRVVLGVALLLAAGALALDMSGRAPRIAGTDHLNQVAFVATVRGGQALCQPQMILPQDAQRVQMLIGTYGPPVPSLAISFLDAGGRVLTRGRLPAGARQGEVVVPIGYPHGATVEGTLCVRVGAARRVALAGDIFPPGPSSEQIAGRPQAGRIAVTYLRPGRESWWQLLPTLSHRFGLGKASFFGDWTLPLAAIMLLGLWVAVARLLARELT
jgi:hypothetical protein